MSRCLAVALSAVVLVSAASMARGAEQAGLSFSVSKLPGGGHPFAIVTADLDGDGVIDLAVTNPKVSTVSLYKGNGDGTFATARTLKTGKGPRGLFAADFDQNGRLDLAVVSTEENRVYIHINDGDLRLARSRPYAVRSRPFMLDAGDLDLDGHLDLVVANEGETAEGKALSVLLGDGTGGFEVTSYATGKWAADVAVADYDRDGNLDVAVSTWGSNDINVHRGKGDGSLKRGRSFTYPGHGLYRVLAVDLNADSNPDMVWNDLQRDGLYVLYGDGGGDFPRTELLAAQAGVRHALADDLNGDGHLDLVSANTRANTISVMLADGEGGFLPSQHYAAGSFPRMVGLADFNDDGRIDVAVTNLDSNDVMIMLNAGPAPLQVVEPPLPDVPRTTALELDTFKYPNGLVLEAGGTHLLVSDQRNHRVARVEIATGQVTTVAGTGEPGDRGDGGPAIAAEINLPGDVAVDSAGNIYIAEIANHQVRRIDRSGRIEVFAGTGEAGFGGDGGQARQARLSAPWALAIDPDDNVYIADFGNSRVRKVAGDGTISTVIGLGRPGFAGDGGPASEAAVGAVTGLAIDHDGALLIADQFNFRIRRVGTDGIVETVVGTGRAGMAGDGGLATEAELFYPAGVAEDSAGRMYVADQDGNSIRRVRADGRIETLAGKQSEQGFGGDGGPASQAMIWFPFDVVTDENGNAYFTDRYNHCVRVIDAAGMIRSVAGRPDSADLERQALREARRKQALAEPERVETGGEFTLELVWEHSFRSGSDANAARAVAVDDSGRVYVAGDVGSGADWFVLALDEAGEKRWEFKWDGGAVEFASALVLTADGHIVTAGSTRGREGTDALVIVLAPDGTEAWRYRSEEADRRVVHAVAVDSAGNLFLAGELDRKWSVFSLDPTGKLRWSYTGGAGSARGIDVAADGRVVVAGIERRAWHVIALDAAGTLVWQQTVVTESGLYGASAEAVRVDPSGGVIVAGSETERGRHLRVERRDVDGNEVWAHLDSEARASVARGVAVDVLGNVVVVGDGAGDWVLSSFDAAGSPRWSSTYDGGGGLENSDVAHAVAFVPGGDFVVAGVTHPAPPRPPSLGQVSWRIARYRVVAASEPGSR